MFGKLTQKIALQFTTQVMSLHIVDILEYITYISIICVCTHVTTIAQRKLCRGVKTRITGGNILPRDLLPSISFGLKLGKKCFLLRRRFG